MTGWKRKPPQFKETTKKTKQKKSISLWWHLQNSYPCKLGKEWEENHFPVLYIKIREAHNDKSVHSQLWLFIIKTKKPNSSGSNNNKYIHCPTLSDCHCNCKKSQCKFQLKRNFSPQCETDSFSLWVTQFRNKSPFLQIAVSPILG